MTSLIDRLVLIREKFGESAFEAALGQMFGVDPKDLPKFEDLPLTILKGNFKTIDNPIGYTEDGIAFVSRKTVYDTLDEIQNMMSEPNMRFYIYGLKKITLASSRVLYELNFARLVKHTPKYSTEIGEGA